MKVRINDSTYYVRWKYDWTSVMDFTTVKNSSRRCQITFCEIYTKRIADGVTVSTSLSVGKTICSVQDNFCKDTGRKISLTRALKIFDREDRKKFWDQYGEEINTPYSWRK